MTDLRRKVTERDISENSAAVWNAFINLLAMSDYERLDDRQRPAHLIFWYESEVQNGGHLQYFLNRGVDRASETIEALRGCRATPFAATLGKAIELWTSRERDEPNTVEDLINLALEAEFEKLDREFYEAPDGLMPVLEKILAANEDYFVVRVASR